jgi:hypothetical protein
MNEFENLISAAKISSGSLLRGEYNIYLPGFAPAAAVFIAELHVEEIINLQAIRDEGRICR